MSFVTIICFLICRFHIFKVDCSWTEWVQESETCSVTCGNGIQRTIYRRGCSSPGSEDCQGNETKTVTSACVYSNCSNGGWSSWTRDEKTCSVTCGPGTRIVVKTRQCNNTGGRDCEGSTIQNITESCETVACPIDGDWSSWIQTEGECSVTCGLGYKNMERVKKCNNPAPQNGGKPCPPARGVYVGWVIQCREGPCPTDGSWSSWTRSEGSCSVTCGPGIRQITQTRQCNNPAPENGGENCEGLNTTSTTEACESVPCAIDGGWSSWEEGPSECSNTCGNGTYRKVYTRQCTNPEPQHGGKDCPGESTRQTNQSSSCWERHCPVNGGWNSWTKTYSPCMLTCGPPRSAYNTSIKVRQCTRPPPKYGGHFCRGISAETRRNLCDVPLCPVNGGWTSWEISGSECSVTCGQGNQQTVYSRQCTNPQPQHGGDDCAGESTKQDVSGDCQEQDCPAVDGGWTSWIITFIPCTQTCGPKKRVFSTTVKVRQCTRPPPQYGGRRCRGVSAETRMEDCRIPECPESVVMKGDRSEDIAVPIVMVVLFVALGLAVFTYYRTIDNRNRGSEILIKERPEIGSHENYAMT